ncbi:MAG: flagellar protein FlaG, partial [Betaproteobacteria bacterium]
VNPAAASLAKMPAMPAPSSSMTPQALKSAKAQGMLTPPRAQLPTDAEKMVQQYEQVVDQLNRQMQADDRNLRFGVDRRINTFVITVTDKTSGDVVRQIPP